MKSRGLENDSVELRGGARSIQRAWSSVGKTEEGEIKTMGKRSRRRERKGEKGGREEEYKYRERYEQSPLVYNEEPSIWESGCSVPVETRHNLTRPLAKGGRYITRPPVPLVSFGRLGALLAYSSSPYSILPGYLPPALAPFPLAISYGQTTPDNASHSILYPNRIESYTLPGLYEQPRRSERERERVRAT